MVQSLKEKVLETIETNEWCNFEELIKSNKKKRYLQDFEETLVELNRSAQTDLWNSLYSVSIQVNENKSQKDVFEQMDIDEDGEQLRKEKDDTAFKVVLVIAQITMKLLKSESVNTTKGMIEFMVYLGSILGDLENSISKQALNLCEEWVSREYPKFDAIQLNTLIVMIGLSLHSDAKKNIVKRVWGLKKVLPYLISNCKENCDDDPITALIVSCADATIYLSCAEGMKFLAEILSLPKLMVPFHHRIKNLLSHRSKIQCSMYAEAYIRAWKASPPDIKKELEENCLQDFMYLSVHLPQKTKTGQGVRSIVQYIHTHKKHIPTAVMLNQLYEPFIWKSLKVANGFVRMNAIKVLCSAFPLTKAGKNEDEEALLDQQYKAILQLLVDPCHLVRNEAIAGCFHILSHYWNLLSSNVIQKMFQIFIGKQLRDASNPKGRQAVINGFSQLLDCADAFTFMSNILHRVSDCCDDINEGVRIAFIKLLIRVKTSRHIEYWKIVPMEHLLHRLDDDQQCRPFIVRLIRNSFIPVDFNETKWLQKTILFLTTNRSAARRFYQYTSKDIDFECMIRFMLCIWRAVFRYVKLCHARNDSSLSNSNESIKENESQAANVENSRNISKSIAMDTSKEINNQSSLSENTDSSPLDNMDVTAGLLDVMVIMWTVNTVRFNKDENQKYVIVLRSRIAKRFQMTWSFFKETDIAESLLYLCSLLPTSFTPTMCGFCMSQLRRGSDDTNEDTINLCLTALCNWNRLDDVLQLITDWLTETFKSAKTPSKRHGSKKKKKVLFEESPPKAMAGLSFLKLLLVHRLNRLCLLHKNRHLALDLCRLMSNVKEVIIRRVSVGQELSRVCNDEFIITCYQHYLTLLIILDRAKQGCVEERVDDEDNREVNQVFGEHRIFIEKFIDDCSPEEGDSFEVACVISFVECSTSFFATGAGDVFFIEGIIGLIEKIFDKCIECPHLYTTVFLFLKETHTYLDVYYSDEKVIKYNELITTLLRRILKQNVLSGMFSTRSDETREAIINGTVDIYKKWDLQTMKLISMIEFLALYVVKIIRDEFEKDEVIDEAKNFLDDKIYFVILKAVINSTNIAIIFYNSLRDLIKERSFNVSDIYATLYLMTKMTEVKQTNAPQIQLLEAVEFILTEMEELTIDDFSEFYGRCLKKSTELLKILRPEEHCKS